MKIENITQLINQHITDVINVEFLSSSIRTKLYKIKTKNEVYLLKIYSEATFFGNVEPTVHAWLSHSPYIKKYFAQGNSQFGYYLLTEFCEGKTILQALQNNTLDVAQINKVVDCVIAYLNQCQQVKVKGIGRLSYSQSEKPPQSWYEFLENLLTTLSNRIGLLPEQKQSLFREPIKNLISFLHEHADYFKQVNPVLTPIDLNLNNFLITPVGMKVLDLKSFLFGDALLPHGEWMANTYETPLYSAFAHRWGILNQTEKKIIHFYALLSNVGVLLFNAEKTDADLRTIKPWGNDKKFVDLMKLHAQKINTLI